MCVCIKGKLLPVTCLAVQRGSASRTLLWPNLGCGSTPRPGHFSLGRNPGAPLWRRVEPQSRSGLVLEKTVTLPPVAFEPLTVQLVAICCTDCAVSFAQSVILLKVLIFENTLACVPWNFGNSGTGCIYPTYYHDKNNLSPTELRGDAVSWGTVLQAGWSLLRFPVGSLKRFDGLILPVALWPWGKLSL